MVQDFTCAVILNNLSDNKYIKDLLRSYLWKKTYLIYLKEEWK